MPISNRAISNALPPWLTKINGTPVKGIRPNIDDMLINDWAVTSITIPRVRSLPKESLILEEILIPQRASTANKITSRLEPIKPNSSATTAKMESPIASGRKLNF